jgi:hypothetical protein
MNVRLAQRNGSKVMGKTKGKGPMKSRASTSAVSDNEEIVSATESGLEYIEDIQESDDSGSEFQVSDDDNSVQSVHESSSEEGVPLRPRINKSVTKRLRSRSIPTRSKVDLDAQLTESEDEGTDDEPLIKKTTRGNTGMKAKKRGRAAEPSIESMTPAELKKWRSDERKRKKQERQLKRAAEEKLRQKLGRRLTLVSIPYYLLQSRSFTFFLPSMTNPLWRCKDFIPS